MNNATLFRLLAGLFVLILSYKTSYVVFSSVLIVVSFSHYLMFFYYSKKKIIDYFLYPNKSNLVPGIIIISLSIMTVVFDQPHIVFFFWFHHVWNETYINHKPSDEIPLSYSLSKFSFETLVYFAVVYGFMRDHMGISIPNSTFTFTLILSLFILMFSVIKNLDSNKWINEALFSLLGLGFALISINSIGGTVDHILLYHFLYWMLYPITFKRPEGNAKYIIMTIISILIFIPITPIFPQELITETQANKLIRAIGYIHILFSLGVSYYHPKIIRQFFMKNQGLKL